MLERSAEQCLLQTSETQLWSELCFCLYVKIILDTETWIRNYRVMSLNPERFSQ